MYPFPEAIKNAAIDRQSEVGETSETKDQEMDIAVVEDKYLLNRKKKEELKQKKNNNKKKYKIKKD